MIGREYVVRQATTLLRLSKLASALAKAADLKAQVDDAPFPDPSPDPADEIARQ